jgi:hypothetical protein
VANALGSQLIQLFRESRGQHSPRTAEIADWAIEARGADQQNGVKHYLAAGRRRDSLASELRDRPELASSWLAGLIGKYVFRSEEEREADITAAIESHEVRRARQEQRGPILKRILDWWRDEGHFLLDARKFQLFDPIQHGALHRHFNRNDIDQRKAWMRLFIIGISHTMGRKVSSQDAGFLDFIESHGWLDDFVDPDGQPERWIEILRDYLEEQIDESR